MTDLSETPTDHHQDPRRNVTCRLIAYDEGRDVSVFLTDRDRVFVHDGRTMRNWTLADPKVELRDWPPTGQYDLAMNALTCYSLQA